MRVRHLEPPHLPQLLELVNVHLGAVVPGWALTGGFLAETLQRNFAEYITDPWAAGWAILARGRKQERVTLVELPPEERVPILERFPREVPHGVEFFVRAGIVESADPDAFAAAAPRCAVFRAEG
jgi:hypothetical protein